MAIYADCESKRRARKNITIKKKIERKRIYMKSYEKDPKLRKENMKNISEKKIEEYLYEPETN